MPTISANIKWATNLEELRRELKSGTDQVVVLQKAAERTERSLGGEGLMRSANNAAAAISQLGGVTKLTASEQDKVNSLMDRAIEKYRALGLTAPAALQQIADATHQIEQPTSRLSSLFTSTFGQLTAANLAAGAIEKVGGAIFEAAKAVPDLVERVIGLGSQLFTTSLKTGISVESLSKLRFVASQTGTDLGSLTTSIFRMEANLGAVGDAGKKARDAISRLSLDVNDLKNSKPDEAFVTILDKMHQLPNASDRAAIGMAIFSRSFKDNAQLASEDIKGLIKEAEDLGIVMTTDMAASAKAAEDAMSLLKFQLEGVANRLGAAFLPAVIGVSHDLSTLFSVALDESNKKLDAMGKPGSGFLATVARAMGTGSGAIAAQTDLYYTLRDAVIAFVRSGVEPLITAFGFVGQEFNASRVLAETVLGGYQALAYGVEYLMLQLVKLDKIADPLNAKQYNDASRSIEKDMDRLAASMAVGQDNIKKYKDNEKDWANGAAQINAQIEAGLKGVEASHVDVAAIIAKVAQLSHDAAASTHEDADTTGSALDSLSKKFNKAFDELDVQLKMAFAAGLPMSIILKEFGSQITEVTDKAPIFGRALTSAIQTASDALNKANFDKVFAKALTELSTDARQMTAAMVKASEAAAQKWPKELENINKDTIKSGQTLNEDLLSLEEDSLEHRLAVVKLKYDKEREQVRQFAGPFMTDQLNAIDMKEQRAADEATSAWRLHVADMKAAVNSYGNIFKAALADVPKTIQQALTGGGGFKGAFDSITSSLGSALGGKGLTDLFNKGATGLLNTFGIGFTSMLGSIIPGIGSAVGSLIGPVIEKIAGLFNNSKGRDLASKLVTDAFGSFDDLRKKLTDQSAALKAAGYDSEELWRAITQGSAHGSPAAAQAAFDNIKKALTAADEKTKTFNADIGGILKSVQDLSGGLPEALRPYIADLQRAGILTQDNIDLIAQLAGNGEVDYKKLSERVQAYGGDIEKLGGAFQNARMHDEWQQIIDDMDLFQKGGVDSGAALDLVAAKMSDLVQESMRFGTEIPENARPWIEQLITEGKLLDENGDKITDTSKLTFGKTLQTSIQDLIDKISVLIDSLTTKLPAAIGNVPNSIDVEVNYRAGDVPTFDEARAQPVSTGGLVSTTGKILRFGAGGMVPESAQHFAAGGMARIIRFRTVGTDTVPAMLSPGEGVFTPEHMARVADGLTAATVNRAFSQSAYSGATQTATTILQVNQRELGRVTVPVIPGQARRLGVRVRS